MGARVADISALYPQPNQNQTQSLLSNPLSAISALSGINQLQRFQSEKAAGSALQGAIGADGTFDPSAAMTNIKNNPNAAYAAPGAITTLLGARGQQIANDTAAFKLASGQNSTLQDAIGAMANNPNLDEGTAISTITDIARRTNIPTPMLTSLIQSMPRSGSASDLRKWAGNLANVSVGSAGASARLPAVNASGAPVSIAQGAVNAGGGGPIPTGNPPGTEGSVGAYTDAMAREANYGQEIYPMKRALDLVQQLGPGGTGPGAVGRNNFASFINSITPSALQGMIPGVDPEKIKTFDEFNKYVTQAAQARAGVLGAHTDQQLATTLTANPSAHINDLAATDVLKANIALRNMQRTQTMEAAARGGKLNFNGASAGLAGELDPRAFLAPYMTPKQSAALAKSLSATDRAKFNKTIDLGIKYGTIDPSELSPYSATTAAGGQ